METLAHIDHIELMHQFFMDAIHHNVDSKYWTHTMFQEWRHIILFQQATPYFHRCHDKYIVVPLPK